MVNNSGKYIIIIIFYTTRQGLHRQQGLHGQQKDG